MTETTNLKLQKPDYPDYADIAVINDNLDKIDTAYQVLKTSTEDTVAKCIDTVQELIDSVNATMRKHRLGGI